MEYDRKKIKAILAGYKERVELQHTARSGFARCGIYPQTAKYPDDRPESVAEHIGSLSVLSIEVSVHFPGLLPARHLGKFLTLAIYHDAAERVIGDIPDNGSRNENIKDCQEAKALNDIVLKQWPAKARADLMSDFRSFQSQATPRAQLLFVLDKTECVLRALCYEAAGCGGFVTKDPHMSALDKYYMEQTGSDATADVWGYHALERTAHLDRVHFDLGYALQTAAFEDARGEAPEWLKRHYLELINGSSDN